MQALTKDIYTAFFLYDDAGRPYAVRVTILPEGHTYPMYVMAYYKYNLQGDVVGLYNTSGQEFVTYTYDPWGKPLSATGISPLLIANPFRYRGYVYDDETGLYYCNSRYYDPETGRWINADGYVSTGQGVLGYNMYAYCENNPTNLSDPTGNFSVKALFQKAKNKVKGFFESFVNDYSKQSIDAIAGAAPSVAAGITYKLSKGWEARIDPQNTATKVKRHIHVSKNGESYAQNQDGEPHDGSTGAPPKSVLKELKKTANWDWYAKERSWANKNNYYILHYCPEGSLDNGECTCTSPYANFGPFIGPVVGGSPYALPSPAPYQMPIPWAPIPVM